jgi:hypothetical protein
MKFELDTTDGRARAVAWCLIAAWWKPPRLCLWAPTAP